MPRSSVKPPPPGRVGANLTVTIAPGDPLPVGTLVKAWKLDGSVYGPDRLYVVYSPPTEDVHEARTEADVDAGPLHPGAPRVGRP